MQEMEFFDVKSKKKFKATEYRLVEKSGRNFVVAKAPSGSHECWRVIGKDKAKELKG